MKMKSRVNMNYVLAEYPCFATGVGFFLYCHNSGKVINYFDEKSVCLIFTNKITYHSYGNIN